LSEGFSNSKNSDKKNSSGSDIVQDDSDNESIQIQDDEK
jgi:hypothetical protein